MANRAYITYEIQGPYQSKSTAPTRVPSGRFPQLWGVDGRFTKTLRKFYGFKLVKKLTDIDASVTGVDWMKGSNINKGSSYKLRGWLVRWGSDTSNMNLSFFYYDTETSSWGKQDISLNVTLTSSTYIDCDCYGDYLYIAVRGNTLQLLYYDTGTSALVQTAVGAGNFYDGGTALGSLTAGSASTGGYLQASGTYEVAYRYYDSTRKTYSAMSDRLTITPEDETGGGSLSGTEAKVAVTIPDPPSTDPNDAQSLFDTIQIYRTIDLSSVNVSGGILFLENSIDMVDGNQDQNVGTMLDTALTAQEKYDSRLDVVAPTPKGGAVHLYKGCLFSGGDPSINGGVDMPFTSPYHESYEYFAEDAKYEGNNNDGSILGFFEAGESLYAITKNSLIMVRKEGGNIKFQRLHIGRGAVSQTAIHTIGNSILYLSPLGFGAVDGQQSQLQMISALDRIAHVDWKSSLSNVQSATDGALGCSFFLNSTEDEIVGIWHTSSASTMFRKTGFRACTSGIHPSSGEHERAFFITVGGRIVTPDKEETGSGSMWDLDDTLQGVTSEASSNYKLIDSTATFNDDVEGAAVYFPTSRTWASVNSKESATQLTLDVADIEDNVPYVINGVLFGARCWNIPLTNQEGTLKLPFTRRNLTSITCDFVELSGFSNIEADKVLVGAYRNGSSSLATYATKDIDDNPADMAVDLHVDGIQVEPYVEQMSVGTKFELTMLDVGVTIGSSRKVDD